MSMKQLLLSLGFIVVFFECQAFIATEKKDTSGRRILIINAFDASKMKARDNKKERSVFAAQTAGNIVCFFRTQLLIGKKMFFRCKQQKCCSIIIG